jgi:hypothetical protein
MKTMRSRLALISLVLAIPLLRCDAAWNSIQWTEGARPVSQTTVSCWLIDARGKLVFLVLLRGKPSWYNAKTTHDSKSSDAGYNWKWRVGTIAYTIDYRAKEQQVRLFGQSFSLSAANIIVVEQTDSSKPRVKGIAHVDVRIPTDGDAVQLVTSRSQEVRSWL